MSGRNLPRGWEVIELGDLRAPGEYTFVGGPFGSDLTRNDYLSEPGVPVIRGTNLGGDEGRFVDEGFVYVSEQKAQALRRNIAFPGDLIFTQRGTLGQVATIPTSSRFGAYVISQSQMKLTPDPARVDGQYLYHYFRRSETLDRLLSRTQATGVPHINLGILREFLVIVPPLEAQRRIAEILDRAEALRAKRRAALVHLDALTQSLFLDLFGDPATNPRGWRSEQLSNLVVEFRYGTSNKSESHGRPALRISNVIDGTVNFSDLKPVPVGEAEFDRLRLVDGDLLFVRTNGNPEFVGRCAAFESSAAATSEFRGDEFIFASYLIRARLDMTAIVPAFVREFMLSGEGRRQLLSRSKTSAGQFNINTEGLRTIAVPVPPLKLQREFAQYLAAVAKMKSAHRASLAEMDALFASLQHRAFRGEV